MTSLLDVGFLVALAWPNHIHHEIAARWFQSAKRGAWATTPITESGFVRVSSNRRVVPEARTPIEAIELLRELTALPGHAFWTDDVSIARSPEVPTARLIGYRQVTDVHLLALAARRGGRLVTFDAGIAELAAGKLAEALLIVR